MSGNIKSHEKVKEKVDDFYSLDKKSIRKRDFDIFHFSVQQKLWELNYYADQIKNFSGDNFAYSEMPGPKTSTITLISGLDKREMARYCNLYLDGYFMSAMSIFDSLSHEINILFEFLKLDSKIYFSKILHEFSMKMPNSEFYIYSNKVLKKKWWKDLENFRNAITHEVIIAREIETSYDATVGKETLKKIPLPDNPKKRPFTYNKDYELKSFVENFHQNIAITTDQCYKRLLKDLENSKKLPIKF
ncbi:MAG: Cthe_2314 family HEPN domain-containing protein [Candidatus Pacebacteria bacterium]|nr:Cthe_2314 family HEPN domain-containing protein [Candidatus Paceibacterota bacterium]